MSVTDTEILKKVRQWLHFADEDIRLARHALCLPNDIPYRLVAYHAQQCAEKCLKAYCVFHRLDFPYTHNISRLMEFCGKDASWLESLIDADELSYYAITTRYPGIDEEVTAEEASHAIRLAELVQSTIRKVLAEKGLGENNI